MNPGANVLELVLQGGALGLLALVLLGLGYLIVRLAPAAAAYLSGQTAQSAAQTATLSVISSEMKSGHAALTAKIDASASATHARIDLIEVRIGGIVEAAADRVEGTVRDRASHTTNEVTEEIRRHPTGNFGVLDLEEEQLPTTRGTVVPRPPRGRV